MKITCLRELASSIPDASIVIISYWKFEGLDKMTYLWNDMNPPEVLIGICDP